jgi:hypothetical protein
MGGPDMAPQTPQRSERPGEAVALLYVPHRRMYPYALRGRPELTPGETGAVLLFTGLV